MKFSGCHWTPRQNRASGRSSASITPSDAIDVTTKPLISLVWAGFYVMMAGGILAMVRRARDARHAAIA